MKNTNYQAFFQRGKVCSLLMVNAEKWARKLSGAMPTCYCLILCVASRVFPTFSIFQVMYHEHPFAYSPSATSVMP